MCAPTGSRWIEGDVFRGMDRYGIAVYTGRAMFEWDEAKRRSVLRERGIDFMDMTRVWDDPHALVGRDKFQGHST